MINIRFNAIKVFFSDFCLMCIIKKIFFVYLWLFCGTLISWIDKDSGFNVGFPGIDKVTWIMEEDWIYFGLMTLMCDFWWTKSWCISVFVEVFWYEAMFVIGSEELFPCSLFIDEQKTTEKRFFQLTLMFYYDFSYLFIVDSTTLTFIFQLWRWKVSWFVLFSGVMLITYLIVCVIALVETILILNGVSKVSVENWFNNVVKLVVVVSMSAVKRVLNIYSIFISKSMDSCCLCGLCSNFL